MSKNRRSLFQNALIMSTGILASRFLGFFRDILLARFYGTKEILEAFLVAFRIPNLFRSLLGEGFNDSIAVPALSSNKDKKDIFEQGNYLFSIFLPLLLLITIIGIITAPLLVLIFAPGFSSSPELFATTVSFLRIVFVYLILIGLANNAHAILYSLKIFYIPAFSSCFFNLTFIIGILILQGRVKNLTLVICALVAGLSELVFSYMPLNKAGFRFNFNFKQAWVHPAICRMKNLFLPRLWSVLMYQMNVLLDTVLASLRVVVGQGALAAIYYSTRVIQLPLALIAISLSRVAIVELTHAWIDKNEEKLHKLINSLVINVIKFITPCLMIMFFFSKEIIYFLFSRGEFGSYSLNITSNALLFYSLGLLFFAGIKILTAVFSAFKDTVIPAKVATLSLAANFISSFILMFFLKVGGIALGSSIGAGAHFFLLAIALKNYLPNFSWKTIIQPFISTVLLNFFFFLLVKLVLIFAEYLWLKLVLIAVLTTIFYYIMRRWKMIPELRVFNNFIHL